MTETDVFWFIFLFKLLNSQIPMDDDVDFRPVRKNGFTWPFNLFQVISWVIFLFSTISFYFLVTPIFQYSHRIFALVAYSLFTVLTIVYGFYTTYIDPTEENIAIERSKTTGDIFFTELSKFCTICQCHVKDKTKHCGVCNRCTENFDHHW